MLYGECKWWKDLVGENILDELIERASRTDYGRDNQKRQFVLYARTGFTTALRRRAAAAAGNADTFAEKSSTLAPLMHVLQPEVFVRRAAYGWSARGSGVAPQ
jgi:hypothetical protein